MTAAGLACDFCDGQRAAEVLMTWLSNGATIRVCTECFPPAVVNVLAVNLGVNPDRFYKAVERFIAAEAKRQAKEAEKGTPDAAATEPAPGPGEPTPDEYGNTGQADGDHEERGLFHGAGEEAV